MLYPLEYIRKENYVFYTLLLFRNGLRFQSELTN